MVDKSSLLASGPFRSLMLVLFVLAVFGVAYMPRFWDDGPPPPDASSIREFGPMEGPDWRAGVGFHTPEGHDETLGPYFEVQALRTGFPAEEAGMRVGDRIVSVHNVPINAGEMHLLSGPLNSVLRVGVKRPEPDGSYSDHEFRMVRVKVPKEEPQTAAAP